MLATVKDTAACVVLSLSAVGLFLNLHVSPESYMEAHRTEVIDCIARYRLQVNGQNQRPEPLIQSALHQQQLRCTTLERHPGLG